MSRSETAQIPKASGPPAMRYVIIIPSGAADAPLDDLDGLTPLQASDLPNLAALTSQGRLGTVRTIPAGFAAAPETALLTILGYDVAAVYRGRAGFAAYPLNVKLQADDWAFTASFITVDPESNQLLHPTAGYVEPTEAKLLLQALSEAIGERLTDAAAEGLEFVTGHAEEHLLIDRSGTRNYADLITTSPIDLVGKRLVKFVPQVAAITRSPSKGAARLLNEIMELSREVFAEHEVNRTRAELGEPIATQVWLWGEGQAADLPPFETRFPNLRAGMITTDDLAGGIALAAGWRRLELDEYEKELAPGLPQGTDFLTIPVMSDVAACAVEAIKSDQFDLLVVYVEAADEAAYEGDFAGKIAVLEAIDHDIVGPVCAALKQSAGGERGAWRLIVLPDLCTLTAHQKRDSRPVPFLMAGHAVRSVLHHAAFNEVLASEADLQIDAGPDFLEYALFSGLGPRKY